MHGEVEALGGQGASETPERGVVILRENRVVPASFQGTTRGTAQNAKKRR